MSHSPERSWGEEVKGDDRTMKSIIDDDTDLLPDFGDSVRILPQNERIKKYGVECLGPAGDGILFKAGTWIPGGEYVQKLVVRNVSTTVKKLKYKLPSTRYFSLSYPEVVILSPGMSQELDIIFRPVETSPYDDTIYINVLGGVGGFHVRVGATIDKLVVSSPFGVDLGFCPTFQTTTKSFRLTNEGEVDAPFRWDQPKGFKLMPASGIIPIGQYQDIVVKIVPQEATVLVAQAVCTVGEGVHAIIPNPCIITRLSAIGKYAYISLSEDLVNFGEVLTGTKPDSTKKEIVLRNTGVVPAEYSLVRHETDQDSTFEISPKNGILAPGDEQLVTVKYYPLSSGFYTLDRYTFITPGDCRTSMSVCGTSMHRKILISKETVPTPADKPGATLGADGSIIFSDASPGNSLNFRDVEAGKGETRILLLKNNSASDAHFSIMSGNDGAFKMSPRSGVIKAEAPPFAVVLSFNPNLPINYYKRVWVAVGDALPQFFDCMGSGYIRAKGDIKEQRPAPLRHAHIQAYRNRVVAGLGALNPDELDAMCNEGVSDPAFFGQVGASGTRAMSLTAIAAPLTRSGECVRTEIAAAHEFFIQDSDVTSRDIITSKSDYEFGYQAPYSTSDSQTVNVTNNTHGKVVLVWQVPRSIADDGEIQQPAFEILPATSDIAPGNTVSFKLVFRPFQTNRNFVAELEAFVYFKNQRTFRLVNDTTLTPPWCLSYNVSGHSFATGQLLATARLTGGNVRGGKLCFPDCFDGEIQYQSIILKNTSNLPCTFKFELGFGESGLNQGNDVDDSFTIRPHRGEVAAESFIVVYVRFTPFKTRKYVQLLRCIVNGEPSAKLLLEGNSSIPFVTMPDATSDDPLHPSSWAKGILSYGGTNGTSSVSDVLKQLNEPGIPSSPHSIPNGPQGSFFMRPTCVGLSSSRTFSIKNGSRLPLRFRLSLPPEAHGLITVTPMSGLLRGNQVLKLKVAFAPRDTKKYVFKVKVKTFPLGGRAEKVLDARQPMGSQPPEALQSLSVLVIAPGEVGAVQFDPPRMSMDVRLVNTSQRQDLYLENVSDSDLTYRLMYKEEYIKDTGGVPNRDRVICSNLRPLLSEPNDNGSTSSKFDDDSLLCDAPTGVLTARSRTRVPITFQPAKAGLFDFILYCEVKAIVDGKEMMIGNEEAALLRVSQLDRETSLNGSGPVSLDGLPLMSFVTTRATFPKISIMDARLENAALVSDVEHLWRNFSLNELNTDLSQPLTEFECRINASSSPDLTKLKRYCFEFTPDIIGSPQQTVTFLLKNNGHLPTNFHLHLPNEKELELEQWCDVDEPSEELNKIICMIEELKLYNIEPQEGVLLPGQACSLKVTYSHSSLMFGGVHNLPIHVKLDKGKQFFLDFVGRTLPLVPASPSRSLVSTSNIPSRNSRPASKVTLDAPTVTLPLTHKKAYPPTDILLSACVGQTGIFSLQPVPIGLDVNEAPVQRLELVNVSASRASYEINMQAINDATDENFQIPVLRVANPFGVIEPRSSVFIEWFFYPLEKKMYEVPITILYDYAMDDNAMIMSPSNNALGGMVGREESAQGSVASNNSVANSVLPPPPISRSHTGSSPTRKGPTRDISSNAGSGAKGAAALALQASIDEAAKLSEKKICLKLTGEGFDPSDKTVCGNRIEDKKTSQNTGSNAPLTILGAHPPVEQLITFKKQLVSLSCDVLDLHFIPQGTRTSRLVVIRNILSRDQIEFSIDIKSCSLIEEGLLSVFPMSGKLEANEQCLVDFTFSMDCKAICLMERVKINVREIVKGAQKRRGAVPSKTLDRVLTKKKVVEHTSVLKRITEARNQQLIHEAQIIPDGKSSSMPSSVNVKGEVIPGVAHTKHLEEEDSGATIGKEKTFGFAPEGSFASTAPEGTYLEGGDSQSYSPNKSRTGKSEDGSGSRGLTGGSTSMSRNRRKTEGSKTLLGDTNTFILRIRGTVLPFDTLYGIFRTMGGGCYMPRREMSNNDDMPGSISDFFVPTLSKFIAPINSATFLPPEARTSLPTKIKMANAMKNMTSITQFQVREVSEIVMQDLFRSLIDTPVVIEYTDEVVKGTRNCSVSVRSVPDGNDALLSVSTSTLEYTNENDVVSGGALYGLYINEMNQELGIKMSDTLEKFEHTEETKKNDNTDNQNSAPTKVDKMNLAKTMQNTNFVSLAAEILRNTMYNLMQEAAFEEYPVTQEPLAFVIKDKNRKENYKMDVI